MINVELEKNDYYIYLHIKKNDGEPFYVGKGIKNRCNNVNGRNKYWKNIVNKYGFDIIKLDENLNENEAYKLETYWINRIGRKDLNMKPTTLRAQLTGQNKNKTDFKLI
jgi:hypothetical protein